MQLAQSSRQSGSCCLLIVQTESRGSENEKQRHAKPKQQFCDNSHTLRAPYLCSPGPFPGGTLWDCPGGQLGAITSSTYLIRGLQTVRSGDVLPAGLAQGSPEESRLPNGRAMGAPPRSFNLGVETRCPCPSPRGSDVVATWTWGFAKVLLYCWVTNHHKTRWLQTAIIIFVSSLLQFHWLGTEEGLGLTVRSQNGSQGLS